MFFSSGSSHSSEAKMSHDSYVSLVNKPSIQFRFTKRDSSNSSRGNPAAVTGGSPSCMDCQIEFKIRDTDVLVREMEAKNPGTPPVNANLQRAFKKVLTTYSENKSDIHMTASMSIFDSSTSDPDKKSSQEMRVRLSGGFLSNIFSEYNEPMDVHFQVMFHEPPSHKDDLKVVCMAISPSISKDGGYVFESVAPVEESQHKVKIETRYFGEIAIALHPLVLNEDTIPVPSVRDTCANLLKNAIEYDFALVSNNGNGKSFPCHKIFLGAHSTVLAQLLKSEVKERAYPISLSEEGVAALLNFFYVAEVQEAIEISSIAFELLEAANTFGIPALGKAMKAVFLEQSMEWLDLDVALQLYIFTSNAKGLAQLRLKAIQVIKLKADELVKSDFFDDLYKKDPDTVKEIMRLGFKLGSAPSFNTTAYKKCKLGD